MPLGPDRAEGQQGGGDEGVGLHGRVPGSMRTHRASLKLSSIDEQTVARSVGPMSRRPKRKASPQAIAVTNGSAVGAEVLTEHVGGHFPFREPPALREVNDDETASRVEEGDRGSPSGCAAQRSTKRLFLVPAAPPEPDPMAAAKAARTGARAGREIGGLRRASPATEPKRVRRRRGRVARPAREGLGVAVLARGHGLEGAVDGERERRGLDRRVPSGDRDRRPRARPGESSAARRAGE